MIVSGGWDHHQEERQNFYKRTKPFNESRDKIVLGLTRNEEKKIAQGVAIHQPEKGPGRRPQVGAAAEVVVLKGRRACSSRAFPAASGPYPSGP